MNNNWKIYILIIAVGALFFIPYLGAVHLFDWDEINFAEAAREMLVTGDYMTVRIDFEPFHEKPPLFFWMQALSMKIFGVNEFAARFPNAITGIITLLVLFSIGKKLFDEKFGILWVLAYIGSFLPHFYFKTGIIDPVFNLFIFAGVYNLSEFYFQYLNINESAIKSKYRSIVIAGIFIALAVLTKGPTGYLLAVLTFIVFWFIHRREARFPLKQFIIFTVIAALPAILWYIIVISISGGNIFEKFILYQIRLLTTSDAGHSGPPYYHFFILLIGCFPSSLLILRSFRKQTDDSAYQQSFKQWMFVLLCVVLAVFSLVETKIIHYSSLAYSPLTFLAAYAMYYLAYRNMQWKHSTTSLVGIFGILWALLFIILPILMMNINWILPRVTDEFTRELLKAKVLWGGYEYILGILYLAAIIAVVILFVKRMFLKGFLVLYSATALLIYIFLPLIAPKIETYVQGAPIEFYKNMQNCKCYIQALGFKSYAQYFYLNKQPKYSAYYLNMTKGDFNNYLLVGDIDKPAFFVVKNKKAAQYLENPEIKELYRKNGFVFLWRKPKPH